MRMGWFLYLPQYSPDLNRIDMAFSTLKVHLRRIGARRLIGRFVGLGEVCDLFTREERWTHFREDRYASSGIGLTPKKACHPCRCSVGITSVHKRPAVLECAAGFVTKGLRPRRAGPLVPSVLRPPVYRRLWRRHDPRAG